SPPEIPAPPRSHGRTAPPTAVPSPGPSPAPWYARGGRGSRRRWPTRGSVRRLPAEALRPGGWRSRSRSVPAGASPTGRRPPSRSLRGARASGKRRRGRSWRAGRSFPRRGARSGRAHGTARGPARNALQHDVAAGVGAAQPLEPVAGLLQPPLALAVVDGGARPVGLAVGVEPNPQDDALPHLEPNALAERLVALGPGAAREPLRHATRIGKQGEDPLDRHGDGLDDGSADRAHEGLDGRW